MPSSCVVSSCINKYNHDPDVSFHKFPTDPQFSQKWIEFSGRTDWKPTKWSSICSRHFEKHCFKEYLMRKCLRPDAIPTLSGDKFEEKSPNSVVEPSNGVSELINPTATVSNGTSYHEEEVVTTNFDANHTEYDQDHEFVEHEYIEQNNQDESYETLEHESDLERLVESLCRLCAGTFAQKQLVSYSSFLNLIIKCFPTLNLENYEYFPKQICTECREKLISLSIFIDKTMTAQNYLTDKLVHNLPNMTENCFDNKKIMPRIKQEPIVVIKEEKIDKKIDFNTKGKGMLHGLKDKITFKDSKHCEIIEIVNLNTPLIDLRQHRTPSSPQKRVTDVLPSTSQAQVIHKRVSTPQTSALDDDIEILSPTPLKVEEIIEGDEAEENRIRQQVPVKIDHNYSRSPFIGKIEILEERVFKTEVSDAPPFLNSLSSSVDESNHELNRLCSICNFIFDSASALKQHNLDSHPEFKSNVSLRRKHLRVCTICNEGFKSVYKYLQHKLVHSKRRVTYVCRHCGKCILTKRMFMTHIRYKCDTLNQRVQFKTLTLKSNPEEILPRPPEMSSTYDIVDNSSTNHIPLNMRQLIEEASKKEYLYIDEPLQEEIVEIETKPPKAPSTCFKCGRIFPKQSQMTAHEANHRPPEEWDNPCRFCEQLFDHPNDLHWHIRFTCTGVKEIKVNIPTSSHTYYSCSMCGTSVSSLWSLKTHENIHTKKIMYQCKHPNCKKSFVSKQNLAQHNLTHSDERNYRCHLCEKTYKRANGLTQHINGFHLNIKQHVCPSCNKSYALKTDMVRCKHSLLKYSGIH